MSEFRYDLASLTEPRIILITDVRGKRSELPRLGTVVLPRPIFHLRNNRFVGAPYPMWTKLREKIDDT